MSTKSLVLSKLEKSRGQFISGAELAEECRVSRNAVWKTINELRKDGYSIESVNNKGYSLLPENDILSAEAVRLFLDICNAGSDNRNIPIYIYKQIDSTNTEAKRLLINERGAFIHGSLIIAESQSAGRGHDGRSFTSPDGGIYLSIILEPSKMNTGNRKVTDYIAESVEGVLEEELDIKVVIKEKGRIYQGGRKICGILTEGISDMETGIYSNYIVGIGVLVNNIKTSEEVDRNKLIAMLYSRIMN